MHMFFNLSKKFTDHWKLSLRNMEFFYITKHFSKRPFQSILPLLHCFLPILLMFITEVSMQFIRHFCVRTTELMFALENLTLNIPLSRRFNWEMVLSMFLVFPSKLRMAFLMLILSWWLKHKNHGIKCMTQNLIALFVVILYITLIIRNTSTRLSTLFWLNNPNLEDFNLEFLLKGKSLERISRRFLDKEV